MIEFLNPVSKTVLAHREVLPNGVLGKNIAVYGNTGELPTLENVKFAILGVKENRNDIDFIGEEICFDEIRKSLYSLYPGNWSYSIIDLGDIEKGESVPDTHFAMKAVMEELLKKEITPLLLCGSQDLAYSQYRSYDFLGNMVNVTNIDQ
jgi:formiminoglutamase